MKVHTTSDVGYWPCGASNPQLTSDDPDEVTCYLCKKNLDWREENKDRIAEAGAYLEAHGRGEFPFD